MLHDSPGDKPGASSMTLTVSLSILTTNYDELGHCHENIISLHSDPQNSGSPSLPEPRTKPGEI